MRHGAPARAGLMLGRTDDDVIPSGLAACVEQARSFDCTRLISSDLRRARRCAEAIGTPAIDARWRELDFGDWDGRSASEIDDAALGRFWNDPDAFPPPAGERWSALRTRVGAALAALPPEPTLVVTHGGPMRAAIAELCGLGLAATWALDLPYAAVLSLRVWEGAPRRAQITGLRA
jgi:alpha-ribazole phosphatase